MHVGKRSDRYAISHVVIQMEEWKCYLELNVAIVADIGILHNVVVVIIIIIYVAGVVVVIVHNIMIIVVIIIAVAAYGLQVNKSVLL